MGYPTSKNEQTQLYRYNFLVVLWFSMIFRIADGINLSDVTQYTLPAYAIASRAELLPRSSLCHQELKLFKEAVDNRTLWSLRMLDSSGQPKSGFLYGNNYWLGSEHQCYDTLNSAPFALSPKILENNSIYRKSEEELAPFKLNFFAVYIVHNSTLQYHVKQPDENLITLGLCLPATCSTGELSQILVKIFNERTLLIGHLNRMDFKLQEVKNLTYDLHHFVNFRMIFMGLLIIITMLIIIVATTYDLCVHQKYLRVKDLRDNFGNNDAVSHKGLSETTSSRKATKILMCFSAYTNSKDIFTISKKEGSIDALHGIRVLGMGWMILLHTLLFGESFMDNKTMAYRMIQSLPLQVLSNGSVSVDTFFFMSGFLLAYTFLESARKKSEDSKNISWQIFFQRIIRRYFRLTPPYVIIIGTADIVFSWYGKTSQFYIHERPYETCPSYWWRNVFYINNLFKRSEMCLYWSYYLSNDMQFFIIGSFLLFLSQRYHYTAVGIFSTMFLVTTIAAGVITYMSDYAPTVDEQLNTLDIFYDPPWMRIGPYLVGLATAYILITVLRKRLNVKTKTLWLFWFLGLSCIVLVLFGLYERRIPIVPTSFYIALYRTVWSLGIAWIVVACSTNHGGIINRILSFKIWQPFSKLSYCAYLLNPILIAVLHLSSEASLHAELIPLAYVAFGVFVISYLGAYCLSVMFELPFFLLVNIYFDKKTKGKN
ncbi:nose resistant to fluoxetine protein 6 [Diachasma alloeum]|uniref:nose resistant to fluoxetine protein 6 n=1 Tax=Diachasma alloeum TaxID=454923 RepID=UPI00073831AD|nr:nose resistant to fluoxetine protein 6 [Diachasma alloeum]XP_015123945.1 nose resistant to fluoxetine protein 6 [Diachasma alloeum]XP_015123953.1 nose resistant to fluoxetine protein 6 [Diachasma alloeum]XP_015123961.1 nose resistant to fluoxetine protein 6 [Diachasma alloeum]XP_015123965.1 nose resistant to fluoxetine protein 6 [Diachasma alloeum]